MCKRADILTIYRILANPYPLYTRELQAILCCSDETARKYKRSIQDTYQERHPKINVKTDYVTRDMLLEYEGWNWEDIRREALDVMAVQAKAQ